MDLFQSSDSVQSQTDMASQALPVPEGGLPEDGAWSNGNTMDISMKKCDKLMKDSMKCNEVFVLPCEAPFPSLFSF